MKTLLLLDAHAMIHRAYHALPPTLSSQDGTPTNAIYGFLLMLQKVISEFKPTHIAVCFDTPKPTFRKELYKGYQSKRPAMEDTLKVQIPLIKEALTDGGIICLEKPGFEADDVIGTTAEKYKKSFDKVLVLTGDRDLLQLVDKNVYVITPKKGVTDFNLFTEDAVLEKFGVKPINIPDYKALAGDASDNYNTAKGIGPKSAVKLLNGYKSVEELLENLDNVENTKWRESLTDHKDMILLFKKIATIVRDVDVDSNEGEMQFQGFNEKLKEDLIRLQLFTLKDKLFATSKPIKEEKIEKKKEQHKSTSPDQIDLF
jgi:DNA polymerase-1